MNIINLNAEYCLSQAQINFVNSIVVCNKIEMLECSIAHLMEKIPIFLLSPCSMPELAYSMPELVRGELRKPPTEWLGFYQHCSPILGVGTPVIGICPERIIKCANTNEELMILTAKVIVHEYAHAMLSLHPSWHYAPKDEFYDWMEESMANAITLEFFKNGRQHCCECDGEKIARVEQSVNSYDYVKAFISGQPDNYRFGLDLHEHGIRQWSKWIKHKERVQKKTKEKKSWMDYVKTNVGHTDEAELYDLFKALWRPV